MGKCEFCGEEVLLPFECPFCKMHFCTEHRLPENHSCVNAPRRTPLGQWKAKNRKPKPIELPSLPRRTSLSSLVKCPKCGSERTMITAAREDFDAFECLKCHHKWKHQGGVSEQNLTKRKKPLKKIVAISIVLVILGAFLWYAPTIISTVQNLFSQSSYTKVTVVMGQVAIYDHGDNHYVFSYRLVASDPTDKFYVSSGFQTRVFSVTEGATYKDLGIEIKVSEVHSDYIVLLVKPVY